MHVRKKENQCKRTRFFIFIAVLHLGETGSLTKLKLSKGIYITVWSIRVQSNLTETALFFSRNAYCLVTDKRICRIEKVDWEISGSQATDVWLYTNQWWCPPRFCNSVCSLLWVAGVEALLSIFSCCLVSVAVLVVMKCSYS